MEVVIVLAISRHDFLERVVAAIESQTAINPETVSIVAIVDGNDELYLKARNLINQTRYAESLVVLFSESEAFSPRYNILARRRRIAKIHNQAKELVPKGAKWVFSVEDDTVIPKNALIEMLSFASPKKSLGQITGVELGRWGVPYVGAWAINDVYSPTKVTSIPNVTGYPNAIENIDACGLYCSLIRAELYKNHVFTESNGLGPDINLGIELRQKGYENFIHWGIRCAHLTTDNNATEQAIDANERASIVLLTKSSDTTWSQRILEN